MEGRARKKSVCVRSWERVGARANKPARRECVSVCVHGCAHACVYDTLVMVCDTKESQKCACVCTCVSV